MSSAEHRITTKEGRPPTFAAALRFWLRLGLISFGGPASQIAIMHRELVETRRWMDERHFMNGLNFCMLLPGPEAQQLATYLGWRLHGAKGGIAAGSLFVLPSALILLVLGWLYISGQDLPWVAAMLQGVSGAVIAIILDAVLRIGSRVLRSASLVVVALFCFVAVSVFDVSFVPIVLVAGMLGWFGHRLFPSQFPAGASHAKGGAAAAEREAIELPPHPPASWRRAVLVTAVILPLWWLPVAAAGLLLGWSSTPVQQGLFFSKAALVTFGGAYAVLPYVSRNAVEHFQWLDHSQMMTGLALAESTPGPLIIVLQFVGFVAGWQHPGDLAPWTAALIGAGITTWVTFLPSFLFVFLGAPFIGSIGDRPGLSAALATITAGVVGVILDLGVEFARAALWHGPGPMDWLVPVIAVGSFAAIRGLKAPLTLVLAVSGSAGVLWSILS